MKVLVLDQYSDPGGAQRMLLDLLPAISEQGWHAAVALPGTGKVFHRVRALGVEACDLPCGPYSSGRKSPVDLWRFQAEMPRLARRIRHLARQFAPDLVYINGPRLLPAAALARLECPALFHAHIRVSQGAARLLAGLSLRLLNANVVAVCRNVADAWRPFVEGNRIPVIYNGVAGPEREPVRTPAGPPRVGCVARIAPEKGQREFVAAAAKIHVALPDARFVVAGAPLFSDPGAVSYERLVRKAAGCMPVEFTGWIEDVYDVIEKLDLLLVPSVWEEPNPRVILEAFAAGVPVLAFPRGGIPEIIEEGRTGFLCSDADDMAIRAIELLQGDRRRLREVAHAAREAWQRRFTLECWQHQMISVMERCAALG